MSILAAAKRRLAKRWPPLRRAEIERERRDIFGMPAGHPETLTRPLRRREARTFAELAELMNDIDHGVEL